MGDVYRAKDTRLGRIVAIKVARAQFSERFEREARAVAALNSPYICQIYDVGPDYLIIEYVEGTPLRPVDSPERLLDQAIQIAEGLRQRTQPGSSIEISNRQTSSSHVQGR